MKPYTLIEVITDATNKGYEVLFLKQEEKNLQVRVRKMFKDNWHTVARKVDLQYLEAALNPDGIMAINVLDCDKILTEGLNQSEDSKK